MDWKVFVFVLTGGGGSGGGEGGLSGRVVSSFGLEDVSVSVVSGVRILSRVCSSFADDSLSFELLFVILLCSDVRLFFDFDIVLTV